MNKEFIKIAQNLIDIAEELIKLGLRFKTDYPYFKERVLLLKMFEIYPKETQRLLQLNTKKETEGLTEEEEKEYNELMKFVKEKIKEIEPLIGEMLEHVKTPKTIRELEEKIRKFYWGSIQKLAEEIIEGELEFVGDFPGEFADEVEKVLKRKGIKYKMYSQYPADVASLYVEKGRYKEVLELIDKLHRRFYGE